MVSHKGYKGVGMNGFIARSYDKNAQRYSLEIYKYWALQLTKQIPENSCVLEVAPGPGYLAIELAKQKKYDITAIEISETFVDIAKKNAAEFGVNVNFLHGNASSIPFEKGSFDFVICTSSFKNFSEPMEALDEMHRVLKSDGKAWISDLRGDVTDGTINDFVKNEMKAKGLNGFFMRQTFKKMLRPRAYTSEQFKRIAQKTEFSRITITNNAMDFEALLEK
ncbi:MAG: class I SAM-dependent methyltransferase [Bacteroidota bacterium]